MRPSEARSIPGEGGGSMRAATAARDSEDKSLVVLDPVVRQQSSILFVEGHLSMMFSLRSNVVSDSLQDRGADAECRVSVLPLEWLAPRDLMRPIRRALLDRTQNVGDAMGRLQARQDVNVILDPADLHRGAAE